MNIIRKYHSYPGTMDLSLLNIFFGIARQLNSDFDFADLIQMLPKISQYTKALRSKKLFFDQEKTVRQGKHYLNLLIMQFIN